MKTLFICFLLFTAAVPMCAQTERSLIRDGNRLYKENNFTDAEVKYKKALEKNKELAQGPFNLGDALYKQGRYNEAAEQYLNASLKNNDVTTKSQAYHNLGNALLKEKKLPESIAAYKEALKLKPNDLDTKYNLEYAKALLKQQQQQQNKNQQHDDKQKQDKQKEKQNQQQQDPKKQNEKKQEQQNQQQDRQKEDQQRQVQQKKQQISKEDAERILEALKNEEKDVQKKLHKKVPARIRVEKDW
jgi:Ca-activated chloride channel homolog